MTASAAAVERFDAKVTTSPGCWTWTATSSRGYGMFYLDGKMRLAHRVAYEWLVGSVKDGLVLDHLCRNTLCVNPAHLEPVTQRVNVLRGEGIAAHHATKTRCDNGHERNAANFYTNPRKGTSYCRVCKREKWALAKEVA